jgi:hypothetical protein
MCKKVVYFFRQDLTLYAAAGKGHKSFILVILQLPTITSITMIPDLDSSLS